MTSERYLLFHLKALEITCRVSLRAGNYPTLVLAHRDLGRSLTAHVSDIWYQLQSFQPSQFVSRWAFVLVLLISDSSVCSLDWLLPGRCGPRQESFLLFVCSARYVWFSVSEWRQLFAASAVKIFAKCNLWFQDWEWGEKKTVHFPGWSKHLYQMLWQASPLSFCAGTLCSRWSPTSGFSQAAGHLLLNVVTEINVCISLTVLFKGRQDFTVFRYSLVPWNSDFIWSKSVLGIP